MSILGFPQAWLWLAWLLWRPALAVRALVVYLPIDEVLVEISARLGAAPRLVLAAPPGAGKTTRVPLSLAGFLDLPAVVEGRILMLEPRRIAARMAAQQMAKSLGEPLGKRVGLTTRVDRKVSSETVVEVITDGLFTRRILNDPELGGVGAIVFDEFHERRLNSDLGLALALESQTAQASTGSGGAHSA